MGRLCVARVLERRCPVIRIQTRVAPAFADTYCASSVFLFYKCHAAPEWVSRSSDYLEKHCPVSPICVLDRAPTESALDLIVRPSRIYGIGSMQATFVCRGPLTSNL